MFSQAIAPSRGLSPRVRGNRPAAPGAGRRCRRRPWSIPACAGEPFLPPCLCAPRWVYPRVCGGTRIDRHTGQFPQGLSPRVRGNPTSPSITSAPGGVYPRVCGGTATSWASRRPVQGLSPRVRGNPMQRRTGRSSGGSIPACAGEPTAPLHPASTPGVYPRVCGGTASAMAINRSDGGLSPRVRGNPPATAGSPASPRSIPACAGEPIRRTTSRRPLRVYPRVCGGTVPPPRTTRHKPGLSPRVRGNPLTDLVPSRQSRSIPACAGEPHWAG